MQSNGKRCSCEVEVREELGMKTLHTPNRCVHMQQVYMTGDSLSSFSFDIQRQLIYLSILFLFYNILLSWTRIDASEKFRVFIGVHEMHETYRSDSYQYWQMYSPNLLQYFIQLDVGGKKMMKMMMQHWVRQKEP